MKDHVAIIIHDSEKVLFIQRSRLKSKNPLKWAFPTGTREETEDIFETVIREAKEELDVEVECERFIASIELAEFDDKLHFVLCKIKSGSPTIVETEEIEKIEWMSFEEFFSKYNDEQIAHGLIYLRKNKELLKF